MVELVSDPAGSDCRWIIRPNRSLSMRGALLFLCGIGLLTLVIGVRYAMLGAWLILPLQGLEMILLVTVMVMLMRSQDRSETIRVRGDEVQVVKRDRKQLREWTFSRYWARVILQPGAIEWYPSRLLIRSHGRELEIGSCLVETERQQLAKDLKQVLGHRHADHPQD